MAARITSTYSTGERRSEVVSTPAQAQAFQRACKARDPLVRFTVASVERAPVVSGLYLAH